MHSLLVATVNKIWFNFNNASSHYLEDNIMKYNFGPVILAPEEGMLCALLSGLALLISSLVYNNIPRHFFAFHKTPILSSTCPSQALVMVKNLQAI